MLLVSKEIKTVLFSLILISGLSTLAQTEQDSGAGRNGPDLQGLSVPVTSDRLLNITDYVKAHRNCSQEVYKSIISQILRTSNFESRDNGFGSITFGIVKTDGRQSCYQLNSIKDLETSFVLEGGHSESLCSGISPTLVSDSTSNLLKAATSNGYNKTAFGVFNGGLAIKYEIKKDAYTDSLGSAVPDSGLVTRVEIVSTPITRQIDNTNEATRVQVNTSLKVNIESYKQCIQNVLN